MSIRRVWAMLLQELYITKRSLEVIIDTFFFSSITIIAFGYVFAYLSRDAKGIAAGYLLSGIILWEVIRINQYSVSVGSLWNIWSRNLSNMFIAPLSLSEYLVAQMLSGIVKSLLVFGLIAALAIGLFQFNIFVFGFWPLLWYMVNLTIFAWAIGLAILGLIFRYGTRIQALAWGLVFIFEPLTAAFFPVSVLPPALQRLAYVLPPTHVFEVSRAALSHQAVAGGYSLHVAFLENIVYFVLCLLFFRYMFFKSRESGQFARNEQ